MTTRNGASARRKVSPSSTGTWKTETSNDPTDGRHASDGLGAGDEEASSCSHSWSLSLLGQEARAHRRSQAYGRPLCPPPGDDDSSLLPRHRQAFYFPFTLFNWNYFTATHKTRSFMPPPLDVVLALRTLSAPKNQR